MKIKKLLLRWVYEPLRLSGEAAEDFLHEMRERDKKGNSPERERFLKECVQIYKRGVKQSRKPETLDDTFHAIKKYFTTKELAEIQKSSDEKVMNKYHNSVGRQIRNEWGLWTDSELKQFFIDLGLDHPDDMSGVILTSFWRRLHEKPLDIAKQVRYYQKYWEMYEHLLGKENDFNI